MLLQELVTAIRFNVDNISSVDNAIAKIRQMQELGREIESLEIKGIEATDLINQVNDIAAELQPVFESIGKKMGKAFSDLKFDTDNSNDIIFATNVLEMAAKQAKNLQSELNKVNTKHLKDSWESLAKNLDYETLDILIAKQEKALNLKRAINFRAQKNIDYSAEQLELEKLNKELKTYYDRLSRPKRSVTLDVNIEQSKQLSAELKKVKSESDRLANIKVGSFEGRSGSKSLAGVVETFKSSTSQATSAVGRLKMALYQLEYTNPVIGGLIGKMRMLGAMAGVGFSLQQYIAMSDQLKTIEGQIKNVTKAEEETKRVETEIYAMAGRSRQSYAESANLFTSVARNARELGKTTDDILKFTEDVSNAMLLGGGSAASQQAALVQLGQALGSGTLRGDELNSIMEQAPKLAETIAKGMGTTIGNLRKLGSEGKLTAKDVFDAVRKQSDALKKDLGNMPWTVSQATGRVRDAMAQLFFTIENKFGFGDKLARVMAKIADFIDVVTAKLNQIPAEKLISYLRVAGIFASILYMWLHRIAIQNAIVYGLQTLISLLGITSVGFTGASAAAGVFRAASIKAAIASGIAWLTASWPLILIIGLIIGLALVIEDLYVWINGGESVFGEWFGSFDDCCAKMKKAWSDWINQGFIACIKDAIKWIFRMLNSLNPLLLAMDGLNILLGKKDANQFTLLPSLLSDDKKASMQKWYGSEVLGNDVSGASGKYNISDSGNQTINQNFSISGMSAKESANYINDMNKNLVFGGWNPTFGEFAP